MTRSLDGKVAIVTGAARGIGLGIAQKLKADGARVAVWDLNVGDCKPQRLGFTPDHIQQVDVASAESVEQAFAATLDALRQVDILVNNAGINGPVAPCWEYPLDAWQRVIAVDLNSVFYCCRVAIPHMRARRRPDRQRGVDRGQGRRAVHLGLFGGESGRDRVHQVRREGTRERQRADQLRRAGDGRNRSVQRDVGHAHRGEQGKNSNGPLPSDRRGRRDGQLDRQS
jgi:hypothetical protein